MITFTKFSRVYESVKNELIDYELQLLDILKKTNSNDLLDIGTIISTAKKKKYNDMLYNSDSLLKVISRLKQYIGITNNRFGTFYYITQSGKDIIAISSEPPKNKTPTELDFLNTPDLLKYAKNNFKQLGVGSSRITFKLQYKGKDVALKIAKNKSGIRQNQVELDLLKRGNNIYNSIIVPIIDFDKSTQPNWIIFEIAEKITESMFCSYFKTTEKYNTVIGFLIDAASYLQSTWKSNPDNKLNWLLSNLKNKSAVYEYVEYIGTMEKSGVAIDDLRQIDNWGLYKDKPVIIDIGFEYSE